MTDAVAEYEKLIQLFGGNGTVVAGQIFGKPCLKVQGKAFIARQHDNAIFKPAGEVHAKAIATAGAKLWDPSGKGRPMKEWVAVPAVEYRLFEAYAKAAIEYVQANA